MKGKFTTLYNLMNNWISKRIEFTLKTFKILDDNFEENHKLSFIFLKSLNIFWYLNFVLF